MAPRSNASEHTPEVANRTAFQRLISTMGEMAELESDTPGMGESSMEAILLAETEDEMWAADDRGPLGGRDLAEVELEIHGFTVKRSRRNRDDIKTVFVDEAGHKMYLMVSATRISQSPERPDIAVGDLVEFNTSAPLLVLKLFWLRNHDKIPVECVIRGTDLGEGQTVLKLKPIPKRAQRATANEPPF